MSYTNLFNIYINYRPYRRNNLIKLNELSCFVTYLCQLKDFLFSLKTLLKQVVFAVVLVVVRFENPN